VLPKYIATTKQLKSIAYEEYFIYFFKNLKFNFFISETFLKFSQIMLLLNKNVNCELSKNPQNKIGKTATFQVFLWHGKRKTWLTWWHCRDKTFHRQRRCFVDKGKYEDEKKRKEKNISCKKKSPLSMEKNFCLWNVLFLKYPIYKMSYHEMSLSLKCPIYDIHSYLWNVPTPLAVKYLHIAWSLNNSFNWVLANQSIKKQKIEFKVRTRILNISKYH